MSSRDAQKPDFPCFFSLSAFFPILEHLPFIPLPVKAMVGVVFLSRDSFSESGGVGLK